MLTGANAIGIWNATGRSPVRVVDPAWWSTALFGGVGVLVAAVLATLHRRRKLALRNADHRVAELVDERTSALLTALAARDVFLRTLAHDLKTPVTTLAWHAQLLARRLSDWPIEDVALREGLQAITNSAREVVSAIDELHDLTRLEAGAQVMQRRERLELTAFVRELIEQRRPTTAAPFTYDAAAPGLVIDMDPTRLARVLFNLFDNALKYRYPETEVRVSVDRV